jgi:hypothetical protein
MVDHLYMDKHPVTPANAKATTSFCTVCFRRTRNGKQHVATDAAQIAANRAAR